MLGALPTFFLYALMSRYFGTQITVIQVLDYRCIIYSVGLLYRIIFDLEKDDFDKPRI